MARKTNANRSGDISPPKFNVITDKEDDGVRWGSSRRGFFGGKGATGGGGSGRLDVSLGQLWENRLMMCLTRADIKGVANGDKGAGWGKDESVEEHSL